MHKKNVFVILLCLFGCCFVPIQAQSSYTISGICIDSITQIPVEGVHITISISKQIEISAKNGRFSFSCNSLPITVQFSHIGYISKTIIVKKDNYKHLKIALNKKTYTITTAQIQANPPPEIVYKDFSYSVLDYDFLNNNILLLVYKYRLNRSELLLINDKYDTLAQKKLSEKPVKLFTDCLNNVFLLEKNKSYLVTYDSVAHNLYLSHPISTEDFLNSIALCEVSLKNKLYFNINRYHNFISSYIYLDVPEYAKNNLGYPTILLKPKKLYEIYDSAKIMNFEREFSYFYYVKVLKRGITPEELEAFRLTQPLDWVDANTRFRPIKCPINKMNDSLMVIGDFINNKLLFFNHKDVLIDSFSIIFHKERFFEQKFYVDNITNRIYVLYNKRGIYTLSEISIKTGEKINNYSLPFIFIEKIKIKNGILFFMYRGVKTTDRWTLYKKKL